MEIINRETDRLTGLVEELLDFSRLAAGQLTLRLSPVDLVRLVQETAEQMRPRAVRQGIDLRVSRTRRAGFSSPPLSHRTDSP